MADRTPRRRGSKPLSERDWLFGSRPRRRLLEGVLLGRAPASGWTRPELAELAQVVANGGVDEHVHGLVRLGLLRTDAAHPAAWRRVQPLSDLAVGVRKTLRALAATSEQTPMQTLAPALASADASTPAQRIRVAERAVEAAAGVGDVDRADVLRLLRRARERLEAGG